MRRFLVSTVVLMLTTVCADGLQTQPTTTATGAAPEMAVTFDVPAVASPSTAILEIAVDRVGAHVQWGCGRDEECYGRRCVESRCTDQEHCESKRNCSPGHVCTNAMCVNMGCPSDHLDDDLRRTTPFHAQVALSVGRQENLTLCPNDYDLYTLREGLARALVQVRSETAELIRLSAEGQVEHCSSTCSVTTFTCPDGLPCVWDEIREGVMNQPGELSVVVLAGDNIRVAREDAANDDVLRYELEVK